MKVSHVKYYTFIKLIFIITVRGTPVSILSSTTHSGDSTVDGLETVPLPSGTRGDELSPVDPPPD